MKKIIAVYTGQGLSGPLQKVFKENIDDIEYNNIIDDTLIRDVIRAGKLTPAVIKRLTQYFMIAQDMGADIIINTCSSVREIVDIAQPMIDLPIVKIDDAMGDEVVKNYSSVAVMATIPTTLNPTMRMIEEKAKKAGKDIKVVSGLAKGAYDALVSGDPEGHDRAILETAEKLSSQADCFVLAQGSMGRMQEGLMKASGKPVLASPPLCVKQVKAMLEEMK
jgi:aspartate/glutamate racemase